MEVHWNFIVFTMVFTPVPIMIRITSLQHTLYTTVPFTQFITQYTIIQHKNLIKSRKSDKLVNRGIFWPLKYYLAKALFISMLRESESE